MIDETSVNLLYTLRTGAAIDPRVRLRLGDYPTAALLLTQPLTLVLALAAPVLCERFRSGLAIANVVLPELCLLVSAAWTPAAGLLRVLSTQFLIGERRRIGRMFLVWRSVVVYRWLLRGLLGPSLSQILPYPELWVVMAGLLPVFFVSLRSFGGWRAPAVAVAAGYALVRMALSFATDALARGRSQRN
ncbi:hypothetical protein GPECTOR_9g502 [Gonium pectorale]|uniref:Uncharacterized protein n=1 Tax=Gonium pectorale TaxID=33097 RepID=A0A150GRU0_GONPE|nr:hypothetical protein GPECTOR_9g502 [Gonium pectorale]|eukprot:KXZ52458.1 hypothetical protein GPECTOR_9g502 [Gonium pectorale]